MIGVIDSKICNIFSLTNMLKKLGTGYKIIESKRDFTNIDKIILPGVGAFPRAMINLKKFDLIDSIKNFSSEGNYILGICLGMHLLFDESEEFELTQGLGLIKGRIVKIKTSYVLPHMGWNDLKILKNIGLLKNVEDSANVYFVHSFRANTQLEFIAATTDYGEQIPSVVVMDNVMGTQFHPEKSLKWGEIMLRNFLNM